LAFLRASINGATFTKFGRAPAITANLTIVFYPYRDWEDEINTADE
jgi:hypothetical protein